MNTSTYTDYFRQLAVQHKDLLHNPASETGDAPLGQKHFFRWGTEEAVTGLRTKMSWPALGVELYEKILGGNNNSLKGNYNGAFSVFCAANVNDYQAVEAAFDQAETILHDMLAQIYQHHYGPLPVRCDTPFEYFDFPGCKIDPVGPVFDNQFGWRCEFSFRMNKERSITTAPATGTFITTP